MSDLPPTSSSHSSFPRPGWQRRHILMVLLIFLGGGACGAAIASFVIVRSFHYAHYAIQHPDGLSAHIAARLTSILDLTDAQTQRVRQIIARRQDALTDIRRDIQPRVEAELSTLESEIDAVLNDEQRVKWRAHVEKFRAHWLPTVPTTASEQ